MQMKIRLALSMNLRVLPASCRKANRRKALPARCRQHLGGAVSPLGGSGSQRMRKSERRLSMNPSREKVSSPLNTYGLEQTNPTAEFSALRFFRHWQFVIGTSFVIWVSSLVIQCASAQEFPARAERLPRGYFKNGGETLLAFEPISRATRDSVVKIDLNGGTVALAAVIDASGLAVTKASEIQEGKLTAWLAIGTEVEVQFIARDEENDIALVKVNAENMKPIQCATDETAGGQAFETAAI